MADLITKPVLSLQKKTNSSISSKSGASQSVQKYKDGLEPVEKKRYEEKISEIKGQDPYEIVCWSTDYSQLPNTTYMDIINYLVFKPSPYTKEELRAYKGLEAYNQFVNGWVRDVGCCVVNHKCIVTAKVLHSQRLNEKPLRPWIIAEREGQVMNAHCTCMAGLGETCTHVAALLFYIEAAVKLRNRQTCTEVPAYWKLPSTFKQASYEELRKLDFSSATSMKKKFDACLDQEPTTPKPARKVIQPPHQSQVQELFTALSQSSSKPVVLSTLPDFSDKYIPKVLQSELPDVLSELFDEQAQALNYKELLLKCQEVDISVSKEQTDHVEAITRQQSSNRLWYRFRSGRVTASRMKSVCCTDPAKPAASVITSVCYPEAAKFSNDATKWGCSHEKIARDMFLERISQTHDNVHLQASGFIISTEYPHIGASPDAIMTCDCCGTSPVEIKCPFCKRNSKLDTINDKQFCLQKDENNDLKLVQGHSYSYQIQTQMGVLNAERGFFVVWTKEDLHVEEVIFNKELWREMSDKSYHIFRTAILPELVGKFYTRISAPAIQETDPTCDADINPTERLWCYCQDTEHGDMIECENPECKHVWFHYSCIGIRTAPKGHWFCPDCRKIVKQKRHSDLQPFSKRAKKC